LAGSPGPEAAQGEGDDDRHRGDVQPGPSRRVEKAEGVDRDGCLVLVEPGRYPFQIDEAQDGSDKRRNQGECARTLQ
jgi:hypothetical protein